jgi:hypothetical protein
LAIAVAGDWIDHHVSHAFILGALLKPLSPFKVKVVGLVFLNNNPRVLCPKLTRIVITVCAIVVELGAGAGRSHTLLPVRASNAILAASAFSFDYHCLLRQPVKLKLFMDHLHPWVQGTDLLASPWLNVAKIVIRVMCVRVRLTQER